MKACYRQAFVHLFVLLMSCLLVPPVYSSSDGKDDISASKKYHFLYFVSLCSNSHYFGLGESGKTLVRQGHRVDSLVSSSNSDKILTQDADVFSVVVFNSSYTKQDRADVMEHFCKVVMSGEMASFWGPLVAWMQGRFSGKLSIADMWLRECDDLLGDSATMKRLRGERFNMLVDYPCLSLLAQALDIPLIYNSAVRPVQAKHGKWAGLPTDPSYIPQRRLRFTDRMTFFQRVQNVLAHTLEGFLLPFGLKFPGYDQLKVKHNIKPEISTYESNKQALLYIFHGSFGLEFPSPMQPNTVHALYTSGAKSNQTISEELAEFLDTAPNGVVLFSFGTIATCMEREKAQVFADGFATLPQRVLWQATEGLTGVKLGNNTKTEKFIPLARVMEHKNVNIYVTHGGAFSMYEALWAGLPIVGLPLFEDQMDNLVRIENRGAGLALDIISMTSETLSKTISRVINEPKFRANARRISLILRDLQTSSPPVDTVARWILHVTRFGGDHLRPAVQDLNALHKSLLDVYLFLFSVLAVIIGVNISLCYCCCNRMCRKSTKAHLKSE